jgi:SAM-dependent methyltransferase
MLISDVLRRLWGRVMIRGLHYADNHKKFDAIYLVKDPWNLTADRERYRFEATNRIIRREFGELGSILEIGCGEGEQSKYLSDVCSHLHGVDISEIAIRRARQHCASSTFEAVDIMSTAPREIRRLVDLVVACEVLYYVEDPGKFLRRLSQFARGCLVTYYDAHEDRLGRDVFALKPSGSEAIVYADTRWIAVWWTDLAAAIRLSEPDPNHGPTL